MTNVFDCQQEYQLGSSHEELDGDYKLDEPVMRQNTEIRNETNSGWDRQKAQSTSCLDLSTVNPEVDRLR